MNHLHGSRQSSGKGRGIVRGVLGTLCASLLIVGQFAWAQTEPATPAAADGAATAPAAAADAGGEALKATITGIDGSVQVRENDQAAWKKAEVGMVLGEGAEFRTMPRSAVRFTVPPAQTVTLDRLGVVKLVEAVRSSNKVKTNLGMKYGRTRYDVEAGGIEHEASISTPSATLAIRGTEVNITDDGLFPTEARSLTGVARFNDRSGKRHAKELGTKGARKQAKMDVTQQNAAQNAVLAAFVNTVPGSAGQTPADAAAAQANVGGTGDIAGGGIQTDQLRAQITGEQATGGGSDEGNGNVPGTVLFHLTWTGNADLDSFVVSPLGEQLVTFDFPGKPNGDDHVPSGGVANGDDQGNGSGGSETLTWSGSHPPGHYQYGLRMFSGVEDANFTFEVTLNGQQVKAPLTGVIPAGDTNQIVQDSVDIGAAPGGSPGFAAEPHGRRGHRNRH